MTPAMQRVHRAMDGAVRGVVGRRQGRYLTYQVGNLHIEFACGHAVPEPAIAVFDDEKGYRAWYPSNAQIAQLQTLLGAYLRAVRYNDAAAVAAPPRTTCPVCDTPYKPGSHLCEACAGAF